MADDDELSWIPLRDYLRGELEAQLDSYLLDDLDPSFRAWLLARRAQVLERLVDRVELILLRRFVAEREGAAERLLH